MRKSLLLTLGLFTTLAPIASAEPFLRLVQPYENASIPAVDQSFVFGSVVPATASLTINGVKVKPHSNGGFLAMVPFQPGRFAIQAVADDGVSSTTVIRYVNVAAKPVPFPEEHGKIVPLGPKGRRVVRPGDLIEMSFQAAPGGTAQFKFDGAGGRQFPMEEQPSPVPGTYKAVYVVKPGDAFDETDVVFHLRRKDGKKIHEKSGASIIVQRRETPRLVELKEDAVLLTGPDSDFGYNLFGLQGVRLEVTGEHGDFVRVAVGGGNEGWVRRSSLMDVPAGSLLPRSVSRNLRVWTNGVSTFVELPLQNRHLHRIEQSVDPHHLKLTLFGVTADSDRIRYATRDSAVREITWFQPDPQTFTLDIRTRMTLGWGYDVRYENNTLVLEIRHRPLVTGKPINGKIPSMKGVRVALDAGHSTQSFGTIGPWGNTEAAVNLAAARAIKQELERRGAQVVMIQDGTKELSLPDRVTAAWKAKAHFFLSIHCDAVPEGSDPRESEGYSVHYYQPQSQAFASTLHKIYGRTTEFRDAGLWRSNLAVARTTTMPSVLLEMGFLVLPESEETLLSARHQKQVGEIVAASILETIDRGQP